MKEKWLIRKSSGVWWVVPPDSRGLGMHMLGFGLSGAIRLVAMALRDPDAWAQNSHHVLGPLPKELAIRIEQMDESRFPDPWKVTR